MLKHPFIFCVGFLTLTGCTTGNDFSARQAWYHEAAPNLPTAETNIATCELHPLVYQERHISNGKTDDFICYESALKRLKAGDRQRNPYLCPESIEFYQKVYLDGEGEESTRGFICAIVKP